MALPMSQSEDESLDNSLEKFKEDVLQGLSKEKKEIPSIYFYDEQGSKLFNQITKHPDYYLTNCELEILEGNKGKISRLFKEEALNLIEFGPGEGVKTTLLIEQFLKDNIHFTYYPIDISKQYLDNICSQLQDKFSKLIVVPENKDYLEGVEEIVGLSKGRNLILFLGSSIGNLDIAASKRFFKNILKELNPGDYLLVGFDLCKHDIEVMIRAYNDSDGLTREFNLNLLKRMNRELGANFVIEDFMHYGTYNANKKAMDSFLISLKKQAVMFVDLNQTFQFEPFEAIHVEYSHKYIMSEIQDLANDCGFEIIETFFDSRHYFLDSLWRVPS